jgi:hypothetical protein
MKVAIILPSRGLIFSQTAEEILKNVKGIPHKFFFAHKLPIPECFEKPTKEAMKDPSITHFWFVEDDMAIPINTLKKMLQADANVITCDYPINTAGRGSVFYDNGGNVVFCGTGCMLVKREVLENLKRPWFTDKVRWTMLNYGEAIKMTAQKNTGGGYGLHDITFCMKLWKNGVRIKVLPAKLGQRKLLELGKSGSNDGAHKIELWTKVIKDLRLKELQGQPVALGAKGSLITVRTPSGEVNATREHADKLVEEGLAEYPPKSYLIVDYGEDLL